MSSKTILPTQMFLSFLLEFSSADKVLIIFQHTIINPEIIFIKFLAYFSLKLQPFDPISLIFSQCIFPLLLAFLDLLYISLRNIDWFDLFLHWIYLLHHLDFADLLVLNTWIVKKLLYLFFINQLLHHWALYIIEPLPSRWQTADLIQLQLLIRWQRWIPFQTICYLFYMVISVLQFLERP